MAGIIQARNPENAGKVRALANERRAVLRELLGIEPPEDPNLSIIVSLHPYALMLDYLPPDKRAEVLNLREGHYERLIKIHGGGGNPTDENQANAMNAALKELESTLAGTLSPEDFEEYQLRMSSTASRMRRELVGFNPTEQEFRDDLPRILAHMDQPSIDGVNTWFVSKAAREQGLKVALSGLGGDEFFSGYPSFIQIPRWVRTFALPSRVPGLGWAARQFMRTMGPKSLSPKAASLVEYGGSWAGAYLLRRGLHE